MLTGEGIAILLAIPLYYLPDAIAQAAKIKRDTCVCLDGGQLLPVRQLELAASDERISRSPRANRAAGRCQSGRRVTASRYEGRIVCAWCAR